MWSIIILCSVILIGCETSGNSGAIPVIRPAKIDLNGVRGFAVVENSSNTAETRADGDESSYSHLLYTIDENGELHLSIFYFEVVPSEGGDTKNPKPEVMEELSKALQVVPLVVSDLGKYIVFSGCQYEMNDTITMSDEARAICERYTEIANNTAKKKTFLIRKSDGALFDLTDQIIFTFAYIYNDEIEYAYESWYLEGAFGWHMPTDRYLTSAKGNLYVQTHRPDYVSQIVDNGDAIDVKKITQDYWDSRFIVDANENIYIYAYDHSRCRAELNIYLSNGKFDVIDMSALEYEYMDMRYDDNNIAYLFFRNGGYYDDDKGYDMSYICASILLDGNCIERNKMLIRGWAPLYYIGYSNGYFKWLYDDVQILTYNKDKDEWTLEELPEDLRNIFTEKYDFLLCGVKSYGVNVKGNTFEINEIDIANKSYRQYSFNVDLSYIKGQSYNAFMVNESPYLVVSGKSSESGADVSFVINLANGENNSTFATDNRNVVSFFRIN